MGGWHRLARRWVLIVEDEAAIRELLRLHLSLGGFDVAEVADGIRALDLGRSTPFDLIVLDVMLPGIDGVTLCRAFRNEGVNAPTPILMLTARDTESDKVLGLESGADDYLTKPFGIRELMARVAARLRRTTRIPATEAPRDTRVLRTRDLIIDAEKRTTTVRGVAVELTKQEFDLLHLSTAVPGNDNSRAMSRTSGPGAGAGGRTTMPRSSFAT